MCNGVSAVNLHFLVKNALNLAITHDVKVRSITCDGTSANLECMRMFGCKLGSTVSQINGIFKFEPYDHDLVFVPVACHTLKLARNSLADLKELEDGDGNIIKGQLTSKIFFSLIDRKHNYRQ